MEKGKDIYKKHSVKSPSTEFSDEIIEIVNEINDFVAVLEARQAEFAENLGKSTESAGSGSGSGSGSRSDYSGTRLLDYHEVDSGTDVLSYYGGSEDRIKTQSASSSRPTSTSDSKTNSKSDSRSSGSKCDSYSDTGRRLDRGRSPPSSEEENDYEPIGNIFPGSVPIPRVKSTATATATVLHPTHPQGGSVPATPPKGGSFQTPARKPSPPPKPPGLQKMVEPGQAPKTVQALHNFKGTNNDELCFNKGDIITVTQVVEGGWWEGTLSGKTGWFPSNYVREVNPDTVVGAKDPTAPQLPQELTGKHHRESMQYYHNVVLQNVIETERAHVAEMVTVLQTYIRPILSSSVLSSSDYAQLTGNLEDIIAFQQKFLVSLEECSKHVPHQRRVGGVFMKNAPSMKDLYSNYCANHPRAVAVLQKHRDALSKFLEDLGAPPPGAMMLTTNLSKPFTRLDKYPSLLKELERHIEESHVDRGDTQRAIAVYRDIANACMEIRKLKEMEYEICTSSIKEWEGEEMSKLGEVIHLSQVKIHTHLDEKFERIFVLFPNVLLMLSMSPRLSGYQYEGKIPLSGITVCKCEDEENFPNALEISGPMIEKMTVTCGTRTELCAWLDALKSFVIHPQSSGSTQPVTVQVSTSQPSISTLPQARPTSAKVTVSQYSHSVVNFKVSKVWSMSCLRPAPPLRPPLLYREEGVRSPRAGRKLGRRKPERTMSQDEYDYRWKRYDPRTNEEDALILKVVEAYCTSAKTRHTVNSSILYSPNVLIAEEEKIFIDDGGGTPDSVQENTKSQTPKGFVTPVNIHSRTPVKEGFVIKPTPPAKSEALSAISRSLVDTVYSLRDQVKSLEQEQKRIRRDFEDEQRARKALENLMNKFLKGQNLTQTKDIMKVEENHT